MPDAARRNPDWEWDETVLACDLVYQNGWQPLSPEDERVIDLSRILRRMSLHPVEARLASFRNEDGVARKTHNLASASPDWGKWRSNGSQRDHEVVDQFWATPDVMHSIAQDLLHDALSDAPENSPRFQEYDDGSVLEGRYLWRFHAERERNSGPTPQEDPERPAPRRSAGLRGVRVRLRAGLRRQGTGLYRMPSRSASSRDR